MASQAVGIPDDVPWRSPARSPAASPRAQGPCSTPPGHRWVTASLSSASAPSAWPRSTPAARPMWSRPSRRSSAGRPTTPGLHRCHQGRRAGDRRHRNAGVAGGLGREDRRHRTGLGQGIRPSVERDPGRPRPRCGERQVGTASLGQGFLHPASRGDAESRTLWQPIRPDCRMSWPRVRFRDGQSRLRGGAGGLRTTGVRGARLAPQRRDPAVGQAASRWRVACLSVLSGSSRRSTFRRFLRCVQSHLPSRSAMP